MDATVSKTPEEHSYEPELCGSVPRPVEISWAGHFARRACWLLIAVGVPLSICMFIVGSQAGATAQQHAKSLGLLVWAFTFVGLTVAVELYLRLRLHQLSYGALATGTILSWKAVDKKSGTITYEFQTNSGDRRQAEFNLPVERKDQYRAGRKFTVLYSLRRPRFALPYFQFAEVRIAEGKNQC